MAIDPSISLAVRPVQMPVPTILSPVDRLAQVLSLRNLMTQGQLGQLGLQEKTLQYQQLQQAAQERANLASLYGAKAQAPTMQPPMEPPPAALPVAPVQGTPPGGTVAQTAPAAIPPDSGLPALPAAGLPAVPPAGAPLGGLMAPPPAAQPPAAQPPAPPAAPAAPGPAMGAATVADPFANLPSYSEILRQAPTTGFAHIETIAKAKKAYYDNLDEQNKAQQAQWDGLSRIAAGVHDEPSKFAGIAQAFSEGRISADVRDQLLSHPYNKEEWDRFQTQALEGKARLQEVRDQINQKAKEAEEAQKAILRPFEIIKTAAEATEATAKAKTATYGSVAQDAARPTNQAEWDTFRAGVPDPLRSQLPQTYSPAAQQLTVSHLGQTPDQQITTAETARQHKQQNAFEQARLGIEQSKNAREEKIFQETYGAGANQALVGVDPKLRVQVTKEAQKAADEYLKANEAADQMQTMINLARSGNKAAGSNLPLVGVETLNAINGIKRINRSEIEQYQGAGNLYDKIMGKIGGLAVGQPIPADVMNDIESMHNLLRQNATNSYKTRLQSINDNYKSNFQPVKSSTAQAGGEPKISLGAVKVMAPNPDGTTTTISFPDLTSAEKFKKAHGIQ